MNLRIRAIPVSGASTTFDYFVPPFDNPVYPLEFGYMTDNSDTIYINPYGFVFRYTNRAPRRTIFNFNYISPTTMNIFNIMCGSVLGSFSYYYVIAFGSLVNAGSSWAWLETANQIYGTGILRFTEQPKMIDLDLYSCTLEFIEFSKTQQI